MNRSVAISAVLLALNPCTVTYACSCAVTTLEQRYARADNILIAKISGCTADKLSENGYCSSQGWTFETIEDLKGSNAQALPSDAGPAVSSCDIDLKIGET